MGCINKCRQLFHSDARLAKASTECEGAKQKYGPDFGYLGLPRTNTENAAIWFRRLWTEYTTQALEVWIDPVHLYILVCVTSIYTLHNKQSITHFKGLKLLSVDTERGYNFSKWLCYTYTLAIDCSVCSAWQFYCLVSATCRNWGNQLVEIEETVWRCYKQFCCISSYSWIARDACHSCKYM